MKKEQFENIMHDLAKDNYSSNPKYFTLKCMERAYNLGRPAAQFRDSSPIEGLKEAAQLANEWVDYAGNFHDHKNVVPLDKCISLMQEYHAQFSPVSQKEGELTEEIREAANRDWLLRPTESEFKNRHIAAFTRGTNWKQGKETEMQARIDELEKVLNHINQFGQDEGRDGCTYGDTDFDSISAAYGYNQCLNHVQNLAKEVLNPKP